MSASRGADPQSASLLGEISSAFDHAPWAVTELSEETHIVRYANSAFCKLIGKSQDDVVGRRFDQLLPPGESCLTLLDRVYSTGFAETYTTPEQPPSSPGLVFACHRDPIFDWKLYPTN